MRLALIEALRHIADTEVMPRYQCVLHDRKADGSLFTEADLVAQRALERLLPEIYPCPVLGEEMDEAQQHRLWTEHDMLWCVDPIDGTSNFVHGIPYFGLSAALLQGGRTLLGCVYDPNRQEAFSAQKGVGAWLNQQVLMVEPKPDRLLGHAMAAVDFKRLPKPLVTRLTTDPPYASQRNFGACTLEWCYVAAQRVGVLLHGGQKLWDYAAGALILEEAGGFYRSLDGQPWWQGEPWTRSVLAAGQQSLFQSWRTWLDQEG